MILSPRAGPASDPSAVTLLSKPDPPARARRARGLDHRVATSLYPWSKSCQALLALFTRPFGCGRPLSGVPTPARRAAICRAPDAGDRAGPLPPGIGRGHNVARSWFGHDEKDGVLDRVAGVRAGRGRLGRQPGPAVCRRGPFLFDPDLLVAAVPGVSG